MSCNVCLQMTSSILDQGKSRGLDFQQVSALVRLIPLIALAGVHALVARVAFVLLCCLLVAACESIHEHTLQITKMEQSNDKR